MKAGIDDGNAALLVVIGYLAVESGQRESRESRAAVLRDLSVRGMKRPRLMVADGHLGNLGYLGRALPAVP